MSSESQHEEPLLDGLDRLPDGVFDLPQASSELRQAIARQTGAVIRGRSSRRRLLRLAGVLIAYLAGIVTASLAFWPGPAGPARQQQQAGQVAREPQVENELAPASITDPLVLRNRVLAASPEERPQLLRRAGDLYLSEQGDVELALHCYRQALELMSPAELAKYDPRDSWLLAELKQARQSKSLQN